jgi:hypothetical protein
MNLRLEVSPPVPSELRGLGALRRIVACGESAGFLRGYVDL